MSRRSDREWSKMMAGEPIFVIAVEYLARRLAKAEAAARRRLARRLAKGADNA